MEERGVRDCSKVPATVAGLAASAHKLQTKEETNKQAVEQEAHAIKRQLGMQCALVASSMPLYWKTLVPVLVPVVGRFMCMVKCIEFKAIKWCNG